ncbi:MAG: hypothetical protein M1818_002452 [Claussenomyces sp. TS43310]|nr:MAG: hypothetical protein M1818_002452 [Claussenomyces sp. TS43310]
MHSSLVRAQNIFGFFTTVAFTIAALVATSDLFLARTPSASLAVGNVQVVRGRPHYYSTKKEEYANIRFSLDADLSSLFTWNTKQVFVYVTATWPHNGTEAASPDDAERGGDAVNEAVIWDQIITAPSSDHLSNIGPAALRKLIKSAKGKSIDPSRGPKLNIPLKLSGILKLKNVKPKYQITAPSGKVASLQDVTLHLHYNVQPWVGVLTWTQQVEFAAWKRLKGGITKAFALPAIKVKEGTAKGA